MGLLEKLEFHHMVLHLHTADVLFQNQLAGLSVVVLEEQMVELVAELLIFLQLPPNIFLTPPLLLLHPHHPHQKAALQLALNLLQVE